MRLRQAPSGRFWTWTHWIGWPVPWWLQELSLCVLPRVVPVLHPVAELSAWSPSPDPVAPTSLSLSPPQFRPRRAALRPGHCSQFLLRAEPLSFEKPPVPPFPAAVAPGAGGSPGCLPRVKSLGVGWDAPVQCGPFSSQWIFLDRTSLSHFIDAKTEAPKGCATAQLESGA